MKVFSLFTPSLWLVYKAGLFNTERSMHIIQIHDPQTNQCTPHPVNIWTLKIFYSLMKVQNPFGWYFAFGGLYSFSLSIFLSSPLILSSLSCSSLPSQNCMAAHLCPCSSSSSSLLASSFEHYTSLYLCKQLNFIPYITHSSKWASKICSRIRSRNHFDFNSSIGYPLNAIYSSNGYPLNAVSLQNGECLYLLGDISILETRKFYFWWINYVVSLSILHFLHFFLFLFPRTELNFNPVLPLFNILIIFLCQLSVWVFCLLYCLSIKQLRFSSDLVLVKIRRNRTKKIAK